MKYIQDIPKPESFIYLASPYSSDSIYIQRHRYLYVETICAAIVAGGFPVYSPIVHMHSMATHYPLSNDSVFWNTFNEPFIRACSEIWVLMLEGWQESAGVQWELELARSLHTFERFIYMSPDGMSIMVMEDK